MVVLLHTAYAPSKIIFDAVENRYLCDKGTWKSSLSRLKLLRQQYIKQNGFSGEYSKEEYKKEQAKEIIAAKFWRSHTIASRTALEMVMKLFPRS